MQILYRISCKYRNGDWHPYQALNICVFTIIHSMSNVTDPLNLNNKGYFYGSLSNSILTIKRFITTHFI